MRTPEELEKVAFKEKLTAEEDAALAEQLRARAQAENDSRKQRPILKQAAFFAARAFDKGVRAQEQLTAFASLLTEVQKTDPSDSFRRKLAEMKSALKGKNAYEAILKKLARVGEAGKRSVLATDDQLNAIEEGLGMKLPPSYRAYLKTYAHRLIGTYEPFTISELEGEARDAWSMEMETYLLPFVCDNGDYFCFDTRSKMEEPPVVYWSHNGTTDETWPNFAAWVEECWLGELED